jgi:hypothetical protein
MILDECIRQCRYFKGEVENPLENSDKGMIWYYEKRWCEFHDENPTYLDECVQFYQNYGLAQFKEDDGVPISLKAIFFNRFIHWSGGYDTESDKKNFMDWYCQYYLMELL